MLDEDDAAAFRFRQQIRLSNEIIAEIIAEENTYMALPDDYEACGECGFDHSYEYEQAYKAHSSIKVGPLLKRIDELKTLKFQGLANPRPRFLESILDYLIRNDYMSAKAVWTNDGDKAHQYPELSKLLHKIFGPR